MSSGLNGTGLSLSCGGVTVSCWGSRFLQKLVGLRAAFYFAWFLAAGAVACFPFAHRLQQVVPLRVSLAGEQSQRGRELFQGLQCARETEMHGTTPEL